MALWEFRFKRHITHDLLLRITVAAVLFIAIGTAATYTYVFNRTQKVTLEELEQYVAERAETKSELFQLAQDTLDEFTAEFLRVYRSDHPVTDEEFWTIFFQDDDGAVRIRREYFDGVFDEAGNYIYGVSGFVGNNQPIDDPDFRRRLVLAFRLCARFGPAIQPRFTNIHATFPENGIVLFGPTEPWGLYARADLPMNELGTIAATLQKNNPEREPVWTGLYFDSTAGRWTITYEVPVDYQGRHLVNPSHDVPLTELLDGIITEHPDGGYNFVIGYDGSLIAHPTPLGKEDEKLESIDLEEITDPTVLSSYELIQNKFIEPDKRQPRELVGVIENSDEDLYIAVASFHGPDWWLVTVYPRSFIRSRAHGASGVVMVQGLLLLIIVLIVVIVVVRNRIGRPLSQLRDAAVALGEKRYDEVADEKFPLPTDLPNEVGLFALRFMEMAGNIRDADHNLERIIDERTTELQVANESLRRLGLMDGLTEIHNRRSFDRDLERLERSVGEGDGQFSLIIIDIDNFKLYNDTYGHAEGDRVLQVVGKVFRAATRTDDRAYRYGGEEFAVLCTNADIKNAQVMAQRIVEAVRERAIHFPESPHGIITISAGVAQYDPTDSTEKSLIKAADTKLYEAKGAGKNTVR